MIPAFSFSVFRDDERFARGGFGTVIAGLLNDFDAAILGPIANLEETELAM